MLSYDKFYNIYGIDFEAREKAKDQYVLYQPLFQKRNAYSERRVAFLALGADHFDIRRRSDRVFVRALFTVVSRGKTP